MGTKLAEQPPKTDTARPTWKQRVATLWKHPTLRVALLGSLLLIVSFPLFNIWPLAWIAPVPWFWLARQRELRGAHPYWALYFAGLVFWMAIEYWLCLPHWATSFGWLTLCAYHAPLPVVIVGFSRIAQRRFGIGILIAGPILWTAFDEFRAYAFTGFSMGSLSHTQYRHPILIQSADLWGEFGVTFLMALFAAGLAAALPTRDDRRFRMAPLVVPIAVLAFLLGYGNYRLEAGPESFAAGPKFALIQGSIDSEFKHDPTKVWRIYEEYMGLSRRAIAADPGVQLVVWPETMFPFPWMIVRDDATPPPTWEATMDDIRERQNNFRNAVIQTARDLDKPLLLGISTTIVERDRFLGYNSALFVDRTGQAGERYDKQHRVIFGEYVPLADWFPFLYKLTPLTGGTEAGAAAQAMSIAGVRFSPSICYETALARVIRRQVLELRARGEEPDVLVNVTNDGWFWGSAELDLHLACGVFRAIESRKPLVVAANTGFSADIDSDGRIVAQGPRQATGFINAQVRLDRRPSFYLTWGDWLPQACFAIACFLAVWELWKQRQERRLVVPAT
ncbi:MAG: apolipoprotein N-acyltransferase [Pirellulales bacterium]